MNFNEFPGIDIKDDPDIEVTLPEEELSMSASIWAEVKSIARDIVFAALMAILIVVFIIQPVKVEGTSMLPRLETEERIFVNKIPFLIQAWKEDAKPVDRGEIIVFWYPENPSQSFIKRVIGLPGETIRMDQRGQLYIDNRPLEEPYLSPDHNRNPRIIPETYVKPHYYFVMGDNRDASNDSRHWGLVPEKYVYGKALFRYWPLGRAGTLD